MLLIMHQTEGMRKVFLVADWKIKFKEKHLNNRCICVRARPYTTGILQIFRFIRTKSISLDGRRMDSGLKSENLP